jgi:hypothetical protein
MSVVSRRAEANRLFLLNLQYNGWLAPAINSLGYGEITLGLKILNV